MADNRKKKVQQKSAQKNGQQKTAQVHAVSSDSYNSRANVQVKKPEQQKNIKQNAAQASQKSGSQKQASNTASSKNVQKIQDKKVNKKPDKKQDKARTSEISSGTYDRNKAAKKKSSMSALKVIVIVAFVIAALAAIIHHLNNYIADKPEQSFVTNGYIEHTIGAHALIVRNENVIGGTATGSLVTSATEGSRVAASQSLAMVVPDSLSSTVDNLRNTQSQISEIEQELIESGSIVGADTIFDQYDEQIATIVDMARVDAMNGNMSDMSSYSSSILVLMDSRQTELSELQFNDERLTVLMQDASNYESQLASETAAVTAPEPGIVSFKLDGQEETLSYDVLMNSPISDIKNCIDTSVGAITSDMTIEEGENVARIASNEEQYIAIYLSEDDVDAEAFAVDSVHTVNIPAEGICIDNCQVIRSSADDNGLLVVFQTSRYVEGLLDYRTVDCEVVITETTGMKVPTTSLVDADYDRGIATIYINNDGFCEAVDVYIKDYDREFAVISPVTTTTDSGEVQAASVPNLESVIITNPSTISPGEKIDN